jgi:hypothetical protein
MYHDRCLHKTQWDRGGAGVGFSETGAVELRGIHKSLELEQTLTGRMGLARQDGLRKAKPF